MLFALGLVIGAIFGMLIAGLVCRAVHGRDDDDL